ncbi:hypothetical protein [Geobacillus thermocatenulatus]|uniref:hypothetical protein n=1 Tax=Geobacillus thermocatenulatus TaxID=33938 RepID=UPI000A4EE786|nr:hypothetical protein [Geobacillus thermocatenulatus]
MPNAFSSHSEWTHKTQAWRRFRPSRSAKQTNMRRFHPLWLRCATWPMKAAKQHP